MSESSRLNPHQSVSALAGMGPARQKAFASLGIHTLGDLLEYFPRTYRYELAETSISKLLRGTGIQMARGQVTAVDYIPSRPRPRFEATIDDGTGQLALTWFNGAYLRGRIHPGQIIRVQGSLRYFNYMPQMTNPKWENIEVETALKDQDLIRSVYPATAKVPSEVIRQIIDRNLDKLIALVDEWFSPELREKRALMPRRDAYRAIHRPASEREAAMARRRLVYDELMLMQLGLGISKRLRHGRLSSPVLRVDKLLDQRIRRRFPYELTGAQTRCIYDILRDVQSDRPMNRLMQGDVGSGKTVVALYAMLVAVANKMQAALLAPTEVLAEQHYLTVSNFLRDSGVKIALFTGRTKREMRQLAADLANGTVHVAIGTQALLQQDMEFANLGLVVVDEQHKLGVRQRAELKSKGLWPHYLVMTATPIPRTLALSYFADFDLSVLDELPPGRQPIKTRWLRTAQANHAYEFLRQQVDAGRQAYIVVPQIEDDPLDEAKSVRTEFDRLSRGPLHGVRLAMLHGQMRTEEKQQTMTAFRDRQADVLVATTVIEVGIDVPNATVMLIDNADRFGLSQLHQLRGRVGRGEHPSHCLLIADATNEKAEERLRTMASTTDGFQIAEADLKLRGPGEFFGTRQHGLPEFRLADITREIAMLADAREDALELLAEDPKLDAPEHLALRTALIRQFGPSLPLAQIG